MTSSVPKELTTGSATIIAIAATLLSACDSSNERSAQSDNPPEWSDKEEVIHQLKEVIRYEDMEATLRQEQLEELRLPTDNTPADKP